MDLRIISFTYVDDLWALDWNTNQEVKHAFIYNGFVCCVECSNTSLVYCGYVDLPQDHPDYNRAHYDKLVNEINIYGGLTFGAMGIYGFDCAHSVSNKGPDVIPAIILNIRHILHHVLTNNQEMTAELKQHLQEVLLESKSRHYWMFKEMKEETMKLADQFAKRQQANFYLSSSIKCD